MNNYFVVFQTECDEAVPRNAVVEYHTDITGCDDIRDIESIIAKEWFADDRGIVLLNFKKL